MSIASMPATRERDDAALPGSRNLTGVLRHLDVILVLCVITTTLTGIFILYGATAGIPTLASTAKKQLVFFGIALGAMLASFLVDYRWINRMAVLLYGLNLCALVFVLVAGLRINGAKRWIDLGPINWQPSETMKIATVLVCAQWLGLHSEKLKSWSGVLIPGMICGVPALLILMQPDLGTSLMFFVMFLAMMLMAGVGKRMLSLIIMAAVLGIASGYPFLKDYQKARIAVFLNPELDPADRGYNVIQSKVAVGSGGWFGQGWGEGTQALHRFLPEHHTDFIFASTIEQFGFVGGLMLICMFGLIIYRMFCAMDVAKDRFGGILVAGLIAIVFFQVFQNIGMSMGLMPVTGLSLPFISYGGSFLVTTYLIMGLVLNVASRRYTFVGL